MSACFQEKYYKYICIVTINVNENACEDSIHLARVAVSTSVQTTRCPDKRGSTVQLEVILEPDLSMARPTTHLDTRYILDT